MGLVIYLFYKLGIWLDENYSNPKIYYYKILVMVGVIIALYNVHRQVLQINKHQ